MNIFSHSGPLSTRIALPVVVLLVLPCFSDAPSAAETQPNSEDLLKAVQAVSENPQAVHEALLRELRELDKKQETAQKQLDDIHRQIELLHKASGLLGDMHDAVPAPRETHESPTAELDQSKAVPVPAQTGVPAFDDAAREKFAARFEEQLWPLITGASAKCMECHGPATKTPLEFPSGAHDAFLRLLRDKYFDAENPSSLLAKITSPVVDNRMPPAPAPAWGEEQIALLRSFTNDLFDAMRDHSQAGDEEFPVELLKPFTAAAAADGNNNTFLTFQQLRNKVTAIFDDNWNRAEVDRFDENIALFGGADFKRYFNESHKPAATYFAGMETLARDVVSRSYLGKTGPFEGWPGDLPSPLDSNAPNLLYRDAIRKLYLRLLFREPGEGEILKAYAFHREIHKTHQPSAEGDAELDFELGVTGAGGLSTTRNFAIRVLNDPHSLHQETLTMTSLGMPGLAAYPLSRTFTLRSGDAGQRFRISSTGTDDRVVFAGIEIRGPLPDDARRVVYADDPSLQMKGPWRIRDAGKLKYLDDMNENKGECSATIPLNVGVSGQYEIRVLWPQYVKGARLAKRIPVEVTSHDETRLVLPPMPETPAAGSAAFVIDQTIDQIPWRDLKTAFRFENADDFVEISNAGTHKRVTADAVRFIPLDGSAPIVIDDPEADNRDGWEIFDDYPFRPYNIIGKDCLSDKSKRKGELAIRFSPMKDQARWKKDAYYSVQVVYAGQADNETRVPVNVRAKSSAPVVLIAHPSEAPAGAEVVMDASASYDVSHGALSYHWRQTGGPQVLLDHPDAAVVRFSAVVASPVQKSWEGLARALMNHPDFLFTRPMTLAHAPALETRERMLLVKMAQDLLGHPPSAADFTALESGDSMAAVLDRYLDSPEFKEFYFRRIRLYLESHGTDSEDEATRLWSYVAFNDRPFTEILTADYTVDKAMVRQPRPVHYGRTGLLTMRGFIEGKPGLPHFNYAAQVAEKFLGYVFEVPPEIVKQREGITAVSTTNPQTLCYSCHKVLTPLAYQRMHWDDMGNYRTHDERGLSIDASDRGLVPSYPFRGEGLEAFAAAAVRKERFIRTMIDTHFNFFFGRSMRHEQDERALYHELWDNVHENKFAIRALIKAIMLSPEYQGIPRARKEGPQYAASSVP